MCGTVKMCLQVIRAWWMMLGRQEVGVGTKRQERRLVDECEPELAHLTCSRRPAACCAEGAAALSCIGSRLPVRPALVFISRHRV